MRTEGPNCFKCFYFSITWQIKRAYACRAMGFKSNQIPSLVVRRNSGQPCMMFKPKIKKPN